MCILSTYVSNSLLSCTSLHTFGSKQNSVAGFVAVGLSVMLQQKNPLQRSTKFSPQNGATSVPTKGRISDIWGQMLGVKGEAGTSAWLPGAKVLLQRSQRRHGRCQFFPRDDTFSATHTHKITSASIINGRVSQLETRT